MSTPTPAPGWRWGPFTFRVPFLHTRLLWPEFLQGFFVSAATGLALVPLMVGFFGLSFEEAVTCSFVHMLLITSAVIVFGEPYAPGWVTPALPLVLAFVLGSYEDPVLRWQAMTALTLNFALLVMILGITGTGARLIRWLPPVLKAGIILGASIAALKRVFVDDAERFLLETPISIAVACAICLVLLFSVPLNKLKMKHTWLAKVAALGLLPGFLAAAIIGPLVGEVSYDIEWGILIPPLGTTLGKVSPFVIGWPSIEMLLKALPIAMLTYVIMFGDLVTGREVLKDGQRLREDDPMPGEPGRTHLALAIRNGIMAVTTPFFPTQGMLWTGVQVVIIERWKQGAKAMPRLADGLSSYYLMGLPFIFFLLPLLTLLKPLLGIALSLTLILTGFACAYIAMAIPKDPVSRGTVLLIGVSLALFTPLVGLAIAVAATLLLVGWEPDPEA